MTLRRVGRRGIWVVVAAASLLVAGCSEPAGSCSPVGSEAACDDGLDDDCDGRFDCADPDCAGRACADDGNPCTLDACTAGACGHAPKTAGEVCRPSAGPCDEEEQCDGSGAPCPEDGFADSSRVCRAADGACDLAERCSGAGASCPEDRFADASQACRASTGGCDVTEFCDGEAPSCPVDVNPACTCPENGPITGYVEYAGMRAIDAANFKLQDTGTWSTYQGLIDGLGLPKVALADLPLNRIATRLSSKPWKGFSSGFLWESGDLTVPYWIPQGLAGGTAGTRKLILVGWHYSVSDTAVDETPPADGSDKGVRISIADVTDMNAVAYRHVLLVEPDATRGFKPVANHAGGLAWSGPYLYVADTSRGMRVFDLTRILQVPSANCGAHCGRKDAGYCAYGYAYVLPQVGGYYFPTGLAASCRPTFSFISLDRSSTPDSILSGEFDNDPATGIYSRILRWPVVESTDRLVTTEGLAAPTNAWYAGSRNLQGAAASGGKFFLNATRYYGALFTGTVGSASTVYRADADDWAWMPEGMYISTAGNLWVSTEGHEDLPRCVFAADIAAIP